MPSQTEKKAVGTTAILLANSNARRKSLTIQNTDDAENLIVAPNLGDAESSNGIVIYPYGSITFSAEHGDDPKAGRFGIASGTLTAIISEELI